MKNPFEKFKIPTLLGLSVIIFGIAAGVFLTLREQIFISKATPDVTASDIEVTNITDDSAIISFQTATAAPSFITFGQLNPGEQTLLDEWDSQSPKDHQIHYFILNNLLPKTTYQFKIISGKISSQVNKFTTASPVSSQTGFSPVIGSAFDGEKPLSEGLAFVSIADSVVQSSLVENSGNFLIPLSQIRKSDLSDISQITMDTVAKLTIIAPTGVAHALFKLRDLKNELPPIKLGDNLDLQTPSPNPTPQQNINFDLNGDGKINAADNAIILQNFGKNPKNKKADVNSDGVVDQTDLDLMAKQINK